MKDARHTALGAILRWLATLACLFFGITAVADNILEVKQTQQKYLPGSYIAFFIDQNKDHTIQSLIEQHPQLPWFKSSGDFPNFGFGDFAVWAHLRIQSNLDRAGTWYLVNRYPLLDKMDAYVFSNGQQLDHITAGDSHPFKARKVLHPELIFPIELQPNVSYDIYLRIESTGTQQFILELIEPNLFWQHDHSNAALMGAFYGIYAIMLAYNLILYIFVRDKSFFYYVCFIASFVLIQATVSGWAFQYLWPNTPSLQQWIIPVLVTAVALFGALFSSEFLRLQNISAVWYRVYNIGIFIIILIGILSISLPYWVAIRITVVFAIVAAFTAAAFSAYILVKFKTRQAVFYCTAWSLMLLGSAIYSANKYGLLPITEMSEHIIQAGGVVELLLLSAALADRFNQERRKRYLSQQTILEMQIRMTEDLDKKVKERTLELEKLNTLLEEASITDPLTGIHNRRYFDKILDLEFKRALREQKTLSLLLFDIDFFKNINDTYGHPFGDEVIRTIASIISSNTRRPPDCLARIGGEEFVVLLPHTPDDGAVNLAERIRKQVETHALHCADSLVHITVSGGVATIRPASGDSAAALLKQADDKLYAAKRNGRNRIEF